MKDDEEKEPQPPMANGGHDGDEDGAGTGRSFLRGCGIALGIAGLIFLFIVGACFMSLG